MEAFLLNSARPVGIYSIALSQVHPLSFSHQPTSLWAYPQSLERDQASRISYWVMGDKPTSESGVHGCGLTLWHLPSYLE